MEIESGKGTEMDQGDLWRKESGMEIQTGSGSDTSDSDDELGIGSLCRSILRMMTQRESFSKGQGNEIESSEEMEIESGKQMEIQQEMEIEPRPEGELMKQMEIESGKGTEMDQGDLWRKEHERLRKVRYELKTRCVSSNDPVTQRKLLDQMDKLWRKENALLTTMRESGMEIETGSGSDADSYSDSDDELGIGSLCRSIVKMKTQRDSFSKGTEIESSKEQEMDMEEQLRSERQRLSKVRHQLKLKMKTAKDPATHRILLNQQEILWTKEQALLTIMGLSGMKFDKDSGDEIARDSRIAELVRGAGGKDIGQMANDLVVALSSQLAILRREITFLRTEATSRGQGLAATGNKAAQEHTIMSKSNLSLDDNILKKKVNLPYLGCQTEDAMDFLLAETNQLLYRFNSFAPILQKFRIPISSDKTEKLHLISSQLVGISELIKRHKSAAIKDQGDHLDRAGWDATWGSSTGTHGVFDDITTLSPMQFTACTPGTFPLSSVAGPALQIYSIKLANINRYMSWPIDVYGVVAARDDFDHNLNILFHRSSANCQRITKEDPFLHLFGPSRAIVAGEPVMFQIDLKLKYGAQFEDTALFTATKRYRSIKPYNTMEIDNCCCTAKIRLGRVDRAIQATIVGIRVVEGEWPFKYGCHISCLFSPADATEGCAAEVVLLDCHSKRMRAGLDGYLSLSRNVVLVGVKGTLRVVTGAYSKSGRNIVRKYHAEFPIQQCQTNSCRCSVDGSDTTLEIVVAWSRLVMDKLDLVLNGY